MRRWLALLAAASAACSGPPTSGGGTANVPRAANAQLEEAREWVRRAAAAPLPTPPPPPSPLPRDWQPEPPPEFKDEEVQAVRLLEQVIASHPQAAAEAHLALAELLAPHAVRRHERALERAGAATRARKRAPPSPPPPPADQGVDWSNARIVHAYRGAIDGNPTAVEPVEALLRFAERVEDVEAEGGGYRVLLTRVRESAEPHVRYGDFLRSRGKDVFAAVEQYRQALIWSPKDEGTRAKIADIYLDMAAEHLSRLEYAAADARVREAAKNVVDPQSPQGERLRAYRARLRQIRRE